MVQLPEDMEAIIGGKRYRTATATVIASDAYFDGKNWERRGRNIYLCRTPNGAYFAVHLTRWQGEHDRIEALSQDDAIRLYEELSQLPAESLPFEQAFPGVEIEEA